MAISEAEAPSMTRVANPIGLALTNRTNEGWLSPIPKGIKQNAR